MLRQERCQVYCEQADPPVPISVFVGVRSFTTWQVWAGFGESGNSPSSQITWGWKRSRALGTAKAEFSLTKDLSADALLSHMRRDPWAFTVPWEGVWRVGNFSPGSSTSVLLKPHCPMVFVGVCRRTLFCFCCSLSGWIFNYETDCLCRYVSESLAEHC